MALIENSKPENMSGGYHRIFDNEDLGILITRVQSAVISSGNQLEKMIVSMVDGIEDLDHFLDQETMDDGILLVQKRQIKKSEKLGSGKKSKKTKSKSEPDLMIFKRRDGRQSCHIIELKDGHSFDTKKAEAERRSVHGFIRRNSQKIPYVVSAHFCAFNQDNKDLIMEGFKNKISRKEAMTGRELCELLEIDYDAIVESRRKDGPDNFDYFCRELVGIEPVKDRIKQIFDEEEAAISE